MAKKGSVVVIKLKILKWGGSLGLLKWALNAIACILIKGHRGIPSSRERFDKDRRDGNMMIEAHIGVVHPQTKEFWQPLEVGRGKEWILP